MGRYYPPDASNPPQFNTSHPLGARANKISRGILTVRFELPFAVWCDHCKPAAIVGQGVRFNAEKKKVGNYHTTPIWSFRMKHSACGGWWEIRTDPQAAEYVVVEGARRRDYGPGEKGAEADGDLKFLTEAEREKRRTDAFANLEGKLEDRGTDNQNKKRVEELYERAEVWRDPYDVNARLRRDFRAQRKVWQKEEKHKESMQDKFSLGLDIADETDADRARARMVDFGASSADENDAHRKPLFAAPESERQVAVVPAPKTKKLKAELTAEQSRKSLQQSLVVNTRATLDPFLAKDSGAGSRLQLGILKRKRDDQAEDSVDASSPLSKAVSGESAGEQKVDKVPMRTVLVGYDSD